MPIMDDMVNVGFDAINPVSPLDRMNLAEMKERYGDRVTLYAELSQEMGPRRKADTKKYSQALFGPDLKPRLDALAYTVNTAALGGGFIFAGASHWRSATTESHRSFKGAWQKMRRYSKRS